MLKRIFHLSRWFHKNIGLLLILYGILMGVSGIFVNHPDWIAGLSVHRSLVPPQYHPEDFDHGTLSQVVYSNRDQNKAYLAGSEGVWATDDGGYTFQQMQNGFPESRAHRLTNAIHLHEGRINRLIAGTETGLFICDPAEQHWSHIPLGGEIEPVRSILKVNDTILVFTKSAIWQCVPDKADDQYWQFNHINSTRLITEDSEAHNVSLILFFFDLHPGKLFGLAGELLFDLIGIIIVLLCLSAFYVWYYPKRSKKQRKTNSALSANTGFAHSLFRFLFKYHLKIGIWVTPILLIMSATGLFMRPPLLMIPALMTVPASVYPGHPAVESFNERIVRAVHDHANQRIIIEATDGFWATPDDDLSHPFEEIDWPIPIHVMGSTILDTDEKGNLIAGSFSGGFRYERETEKVIDLITDQEAHDVSTMRSAENMVTGYFTTPQGERFITTYHDGLIPLTYAQQNGRFEMPEAMTDQYRMPLWNYMFELHNGRFFRDWIGGWYILVPILGSFLFLVLTITGLFDWLMIKVVAPRRTRKQ